MPRHAICKKVCHMPLCRNFRPRDEKVETLNVQKITMSVEEYEVIRLLDYQDFTQEEAAKRMGIARTTVQALYDDARKSISKSLVEGKELEISGGNYYLCDGKEMECDCGGCEKHRRCFKKDRSEA